MAVHTIKTVQKIPGSLDKAWEFFSNPANLQIITPPGMCFKIISRHHGATMYAGQIIEYKVKPFAGITVSWMTEITVVKNREYFVDVQRLGPYKLWHHQHHFKEIPGGVEMTDIVHYKLPLGFIGRLANSFYIKKKPVGIFNFRHQKVVEIFGR